MNEKVRAFILLFCVLFFLSGCRTVHGDGNPAHGAREHSSEIQGAMERAGGAARDIDGAAQRIGDESTELVSGIERAESESAGLADDLRSAQDELGGIVGELESGGDLYAELQGILAAIREQPLD